MASGGKADANKSGLLVDRKLADKEIAQLLAFLETLTSHERFEPPKVP
jgi:hypothetical protein